MWFKEYPVGEQFFKRLADRTNLHTWSLEHFAAQRNKAELVGHLFHIYDRSVVLGQIRDYYSKQLRVIETLAQKSGTDLNRVVSEQQVVNGAIITPRYEEEHLQDLSELVKRLKYLCEDANNALARSDDQTYLNLLVEMQKVDKLSARVKHMVAGEIGQWKDQIEELSAHEAHLTSIESELEE
jgi:hypothetical protein